MDSIIARGGKRAKCILGNYVDRYPRDDGARGGPPLHGSMEGAGVRAEPSPYLAGYARAAIWWSGRQYVDGGGDPSRPHCEETAFARYGR